MAIIILMDRGTTLASLEKWDVLRKHLVLKPSLSLGLHLSSLRGGNCHFKTNVLLLTLLPNTVMGKISGF